MIDRIDKQLIRLLEKDGRASSFRLAKELHLSASTVRRRLKRLIENQTLRIVPVVDANQADISLTVIIGLGIAHDKMEEAFLTLTSYSEVKWFVTTTGRFDILARVQLRSTNELANFWSEKIRKIPGLKDSETFVCLPTKEHLYVHLYSSDKSTIII